MFVRILIAIWEVVFYLGITERGGDEERGEDIEVGERSGAERYHCIL